VLFVDQLAKHPNVFTDTSGVRRFDLLVDALRRAGPTKILFGSDGPWLHPGVELAKVRMLRLDPAAERLVLADNLLRLIGHRRRRPAKVSRPSARPRTTAVDPWVPERPPLTASQ
jgi:predicted TIM-barrel fold metal-dependent hydrolase